MVPPGHYRASNLSNPFNQYPQQSASHGHYQPPYNSHNFSSQGAFPSAQSNQQVNLFGGGPSAQPASFNTGGLHSNGATGLASHEAQLRFAQAAALQQRQDAPGLTRDLGIGGRIREVWKNNMETEFAMIRSLADKYPYVSMDTEFPGIAARPMGNFSSKTDYHYQCLRTNVDLLKLIQLAITLWSPDGELPPAQYDTTLSRHPYSNSLAICPCTWVFNFRFDTEEDMAPEHSIDMLKRFGVDFEKSASMGIDPKDFGARLVDSGLVLNQTTTWVSFHSGYDFGHLIKAMYPAHMPPDKEKYFEFLNIWFRRIYDIKQLLRVAASKAHARQLSQQACDTMAAIGARTRIEEIADVLECNSEGRPHTAGSDAWLTGSLFFALRQKVFDGEIPDDLLNQIFGLSGTDQPASAASRAAAMQTPSSNGAALFSTGMTPKSYQGGETPNTPQTSHSGLTSTPGPHNQGYSGAMPGGAFSNFLYGRGAPYTAVSERTIPNQRPPSLLNLNAREYDHGFHDTWERSHSHPSHTRPEYPNHELSQSRKRPNGAATPFIPSQTTYPAGPASTSLAHLHYHGPDADPNDTSAMSMRRSESNVGFQDHVYWTPQNGHPQWEHPYYPTRSVPGPQLPRRRGPPYSADFQRHNGPIEHWQTGSPSLPTGRAQNSQQRTARRSTQSSTRRQ